MAFACWHWSLLSWLNESNRWGSICDKSRRYDKNANARYLGCIWATARYQGQHYVLGSANCHVRDPACTYNEWSVVLQWELMKRAWWTGREVYRSHLWTVNQTNMITGNHHACGILWGHLHMHTDTISSHACYYKKAAITHWSPNT